MASREAVTEIFSQLGISPHQLSHLAGTYEGTIMICGGASCVWQDIAHFLRWRYHVGPEMLPPLVHMMTVNDLAMHLPLPLHHAYANSWQELECWIQARRIEYRRIDERAAVRTHVHSGHPSTSNEMERWPWPLHGTSGLNAVYTAIALGYDEIVLCGIPLDSSPHYWQAPWEISNFLNEVPEIQRGGSSDPFNLIDGPQFWLTAQGMFEDKVHSMSGRTKDLLGEPSYDKRHRYSG